MYFMDVEFMNTKTKEFLTIDELIDKKDLNLLFI